MSKTRTNFFLCYVRQINKCTIFSIVVKLFRNYFNSMMPSKVSFRINFKYLLELSIKLSVILGSNLTFSNGKIVLFINTKASHKHLIL